MGRLNSGRDFGGGEQRISDLVTKKAGESRTETLGDSLERTALKLERK